MKYFTQYSVLSGLSHSWSSWGFFFLLPWQHISALLCLLWKISDAVKQRLNTDEQSALTGLRIWDAAYFTNFSVSVVSYVLSWNSVLLYLTSQSLNVILHLQNGHMAWNSSLVLNVDLEVPQPLETSYSGILLAALYGAAFKFQTDLLGHFFSPKYTLVLLVTRTKKKWKQAHWLFTRAQSGSKSLKWKPTAFWPSRYSSTVLRTS